ncbi:MAG: GMC family oxidoreductase [Armatimonadetes bacterium]|nr:GMC family oxidoreductase [Armatimonadota bacterium]MDE2207160.1 GMC family oxidoreductase [Armatimonadota bacterium]
MAHGWLSLTGRDLGALTGLSRAADAAPEPIQAEYDCIVIGAGAGGGIVACLMAEAGHRTLLVERGSHVAPDPDGGDHLRNQRLSLYGVNAGPSLAENPRVDATGSAPRTVLATDGAWNNNASCVGGGTRVYGAQAWRFHPKDFRMASEYGVPDGSSLADWPITYGDLAPHYERVEWELGVAGDTSSYGYTGSGSRGYPMPPFPVTGSGVPLARGAASLGWETLPPPMLMNTIPYGGRNACIHCRHCVGFPCPVDAKNGVHSTMIPRGLATGLLQLATGAVVREIVTDGKGEVTGVALLEEAYTGANLRSVRARTVVVAAGAIETARLLLNSRSSMHPDGLGNASGHVGRNLQGHYYPSARGLMEEPCWDGVGPGPCIATCRFNHGNPGVIGGAMLCNDFIELPIIFWRNGLPPDVPRWGIENKRWMRENYRRTLQVTGPVQEIPSPNARVELDGSVRDRWGIPVARLSGRTHPETVKTAAAIWERCCEWLRASGASRIWGGPPGLGLSGGQHQAGTCRMGRDPRSSVTDSFGRVHGHQNLFIADASLHVTNGGFNPVLTVMAMAFRIGGFVAAL